MPASVGRFVVLHSIGAGSAGVVVAAYDPVLDRRIALKVLRSSDTAAGDARLLQEAQAMARLAHPNVVTAYDAGVADGRVYLAMEFVDGGTLRAWLVAAPRTWCEIRDRFVEAGRGLAAAHDAGMVHRDFKPDNVLVGRDGHARVSDFGLVRATRAAADDGSGDTTAVAGTPRYMAPEQHRGERADPRADQFAFCVALYEALWQVDPFAAADPAERTARVLRGDVTPPPAGKIPAPLAAAVIRGLASDPARRYPTMQALLDDLARDPTVARRRWLGRVAVALGGAAAAIAINGALHPAAESAYPGQPDPRRFQFGIAVAWAPQHGGATPRPAQPAFDRASLDQAVRAGATATNLRFAWSDIEPTQGQLDWSDADRQVAEVEQRGLEPFASIGSSPAWAGPTLDERCTEPFRNPPAWTYDGITAFRNFFRALANRYCNRVKYYEFWDEPNGCSWRSCSCGDQTSDPEGLYASWMEQWYQAMREGCRDVVLAVGGLDCSWGPDPDHPALGCATFLDRLSSQLAGDFDAVALHPDGYRGDLELALRADKVLNWDAIRAVSASLQRRGDANRLLWINGWGFDTADDPLQAKLVGTALTRLRGLPEVFAARYQAIVDPPGDPRSSSGLASLAGPPDHAELRARAAWYAFRDVALGRDTAWHGPLNPGLEFGGQPSATQTSPIPFWGPNGAWQYHSLFPRRGNEVLGRKLGYYSAEFQERVIQTLVDVFEPRRRYCFRSAAQGGRDNVGRLPYQIGYLDARGQPVMLNTSTVAVDALWRETTGVCHDAVSGGPEIGRPIVVGFGSGEDGGFSDVWFDDLRVTSTPL